jgi:disulfide bond formation protein DsbB
MTTADFTLIISVLTVLAQVFLGLVFLAWFLRKRIDIANSFVNLIVNNINLLGFVFSSAAVLGSLYYSEIAGYEPCVLCWYQRIFMYPQMIIFGIAMYKKSSEVLVYNLALSVIGLLLAAYHYYGQIFNAGSLPCAVLGYSASCSQRFVMTFGYITIPMMAATVFAVLVGVTFVAWKTKK